MKRILLVKITSMGDLIQTFPALTDAAAAIPDICFDWVAEEAFCEIPRLHPSVDKVISLPLRRWKKNIRQCLGSGEITSVLRQLRSQRYDMVIDAQSNLKSAVVSMLTKGQRYGLDKTSVREFGAHFAYHKKITLSRNQNHAARMRQLMANFLDYDEPQTQIDYGINQDILPQLDYKLPEKFVFVTAISSAKERLWPEPYWQEVFNELTAQGLEIVLPWWSQEEKERMLRLKNNKASIHLLPSLNLAQKARVLSKALLAISLDTGLAHMAASLNIPNVTLYGPTSAKLTGAYGKQQIHLSASGPSCAPCLKNTCNYQGQTQFSTACMETIKPKEVLKAIDYLLASCQLSLA